MFINTHFSLPNLTPTPHFQWWNFLVHRSWKDGKWSLKRGPTEWPAAHRQHIGSCLAWLTGSTLNDGGVRGGVGSSAAAASGLAARMWGYLQMLRWDSSKAAEYEEWSIKHTVDGHFVLQNYWDSAADSVMKHYHEKWHYNGIHHLPTSAGILPSTVGVGGLGR